MTEREYEHFRVEPCPQLLGRKTVDYRVVNKSSGAPIGMINWYGPWRQYTFFPLGSTVWSAGCLAGIQDFLNRLAAERKGGG
jgi:hypothetical protein